MTKARVEVLLAAVFATLTVVTAVWPTWIESLTGLEPDEGNGETEWLFVVVLGALAVIAAVLAGRDYRRALRAQ